MLHQKRAQRLACPAKCAQHRQKLPTQLAAVLAPERQGLRKEQSAALDSPPQPAQVSTRPTDKPKVVVLGSGWGASTFVKSLSNKDSKAIDLTLISPRNYFLYTPLLPAAATGTVEERSIVEPVRRIVGKKGKYYEAVVSDIDPANKTVTASFPEDAGLDSFSFTVPYDILILGVGSVNNTFGIKGVDQHTSFFKSAEDAAQLRRQVSQCFERSSLPETSSQDRQQLLSFVVVGGGPTGVEVAAELHDMVADDLRKIYPDLIQDVHIRVIELQDHVLSTYDRAISNYTASVFKRSGIELVLNSKVQSVEKNKVTVAGPGGSTVDIPFGACVWATGVAMSPLVKQLQGKLPAGVQTHFRSIITDGFLRVKGSEGAIFAIGDAATIEQERALTHAKELFSQADTDANGMLSVTELRDVLRTASKDYSHIEEHSRFLDGKYGGGKRWGGMVKDTLDAARSRQNGSAPPEASSNPVAGIDENAHLDKAAFDELLERIDRGLRALPATAQVAAQQGKYLAKLLATGHASPGRPIAPEARPFKYGHKGSLAYVGGDKAVMDVPGLQPITGFAAGLLWKGFETYSQISLRNMLLVSGDWVRAKLFGRDISRV